MTRYPMFWLTIAIVGVVVGVLTPLVAPMMPATASSERLHRHCTFERAQLATITAKVFAFDPRTRARGADLFADLERDDWRGVSLCVPEGVPVSRGCEPTDYACIASAVSMATLSMER